MKGQFIVEPLGDHDRTLFSCGVAPLDRYFREQSSQDVKRLMASCFVLVDVEARDRWILHVGGDQRSSERLID